MRVTSTLPFDAHHPHDKEGDAMVPWELVDGDWKAKRVPAYRITR